jgi:glycosyltransferase involved in cell wall biosynthesis
MSRLLVVIPDSLTDILTKGEFQPCYYNPGEVFDDVHLLLMNNDRPPLDALQPTVGRARLQVHNFAAPGFEETWGYRVWRLRRWAESAVRIAAGIKPDLVRAYGHHTSTFAASEIKRQLDIPFVVSLHGNPDVDYYRGRLATTRRQRIEGLLSRGFEKASMRAADMVLPVYSPIVPYLKSIGVANYKVTYNAVGQGLQPRQSYEIDPADVRAVCVGRQTHDQKNPSAIIEALARIDGLKLTLIGDGGLHDGLVGLAARLGVSGRIEFIRNLPNAEILERMRRCDLFVYQSDNYELSKGSMEAALAGLPVILNDRTGGSADEVRDSPFLVVENTAGGYEAGLRRVIGDSAFREKLGRDAADYGWRLWNPGRMEAQVAEIYRTLIEERHD